MFKMSHEMASFRTIVHVLIVKMIQYHCVLITIRKSYWNTWTSIVWSFIYQWENWCICYKNIFEIFGLTISKVEINPDLPTIALMVLLWFSFYLEVLTCAGRRHPKIASNYDLGSMFFFYWEIAQPFAVLDSWTKIRAQCFFLLLGYC